MPTIKTVTQFIKAVETIPHHQVIEQFYSENASIQENQAPPRIGKQNLIANEKAVYTKAKSVHSKCILPFFINDNQVVIRWKFRFDWKDGSYSEIEEIATQEWETKLIKKEQFFYDPQQFKPKKSA